MNFPNAWSDLLGEPVYLPPGWIAHLFVNIIAGGIGFAPLNSKLPARSFANERAAFGVLVWLVMILAGAGVFASDQSATALIAILALYPIGRLILGQFHHSNLGAFELQTPSIRT